MSVKVQRLRALVNERLTAAAEEIFALFERTIVEYEEEMCRSEEENKRKQQLLDSHEKRPVKTDIHLQTETREETIVKQENAEEQPSIEWDHGQEFTFTCDPEHVCGLKEETQTEQLLDSAQKAQETPPRTDVQNQMIPAVKQENTEQQPSIKWEQGVQVQDEVGPSLGQRNTAQVKEEPEEVSIKQEDEQLQEFTAVSVKIEDEEGLVNDDNWEQPSSSSAQQTETGENQKRKAGDSLMPFSKCKRTLVEKPFSCSVCEQGFRQEATLRIHLSTHTEEKPEERALTEQERLYSGKKPFVCFICGKAFKHIDNYKLHTAGHMGVKPFSCSECGAQFGKKRNAVRHMAVHSGAWLYKCSECDERFVHRSKFLRHLKGHSDGKPETSEGSQRQNVPQSDTNVDF